MSESQSHTVETNTPTSTPTRTEKSFLFEKKDQDEVFLNEEGWREEAAAVIKDVEKYVEVILISDKLESSRQSIYLNLTTKEAKTFTIELSAQGFRVVGDHHNSTSQASSGVFETPYSLLDSISPTYREAFGNDLSNQLLKLQASRASLGGEEEQND